MSKEKIWPFNANRETRTRPLTQAGTSTHTSVDEQSFPILHKMEQMEAKLSMYFIGTLTYVND